MFDEGRITTFRQLTLRGKLDHALKLYLYFASVRDNQRLISMASHEVIHARTGIPESDIRRAHRLLTSVGLLAAIEREYKGVVEKTNEPKNTICAGMRRSRCLLRKRPERQPPETGQPARPEAVLIVQHKDVMLH